VNLDNEMHDDDSGEREREISLGTSTILGIFFALALVCAAFFGFGYSLGRHASQATAPPPTVKSDEAADTSNGSPFDHFKSAPAKAAEPDTTSNTDTTQPPPKVVVAPNVVKAAPPAHNVAFPVTPTAAATPTTAPTVASGQFVVQVSAPSHQGDADNLVAMLKRKGYTAYIRKEPQDSLLHVQIGPFTTHKDAEAMRVRVAADTPYKPFIK
jgi:DedD protein